MSLTIVDSGQTTRSKQLKRQMKMWREALDRTTIAGLVGYKKHVTQEEAAVLCGTALSHYRSLEAGNIDCRYSDEVLDTVARVLRLGEVSRRVLYWLAIGRDPKPGPYPPPSVNAAVQARMACQPWPSFVLDPLWNVVEYNEATLRWFPHVTSEPNMMRAVTCLPQLRQQLLDWHDVWLPRAIAQLKGQLAWPGHDEGLDQLVAEILNCCPQARHWMYNDAMVWWYEDGDVRQMFVPGAHEPTTVVLSTDNPGSNAGTRHCSVWPASGYIPAACRGLPPIRHHSANATRYVQRS
jgi:hypothetical protein